MSSVAREKAWVPTRFAISNARDPNCSATALILPLLQPHGPKSTAQTRCRERYQASETSPISKLGHRPSSRGPDLQQQDCHQEHFIRYTGLDCFGCLSRTREKHLPHVDQSYNTFCP